MIKMKEGRRAAASTMMLHRRKGLKTERLTLFHLMMKLKSPVLLGIGRLRGLGRWSMTSSGSCYTSDGLNDQY